MEASIQAVSPELICELRMTEGSVVEGAGGEGSAHAKGVHSASKPNRNHRDITAITRLPSTGMVSKWRWRRARNPRRRFQCFFSARTRRARSHASTSRARKRELEFDK